MESGKLDLSAIAPDKILGAQPNITELSSLIDKNSFKERKESDAQTKKNLHKKKGFMSSMDYLSPGRRKIAQLGWLGIWGGLGASLVLSLFQGFKKGFSEPISNTITLVGTVLQEIADYKNSLVRKTWGLIKTLLKLK